MSPAIVQKLLSQSSGSQGFGGANPAGGRSSLQAQTTQPSTQQLRMLVQQIQMAVQAGYLNHQVYIITQIVSFLEIFISFLTDLKSTTRATNVGSAQSTPSTNQKFTAAR